ncbi:hypothetical protein P168DRAFT_21748 [Aspergillus campestris IBT 28561]|uniref:Uncharacterized protein n=1 Tax=Aspergillus campestris (strain IBT 28561) TaxID=1392248 RepID=A0A2I1DFU1_ASPC2|nr:uncharacterized protein P168DRAFT_21748 [Aspergillus campestris IBT 28561]PKY08734.1 hypothetical protein P168DRAFT_21748 [Aspergillus campestris IBT 28561]
MICNVRISTERQLAFFYFCFFTEAMFDRPDQVTVVFLSVPCAFVLLPELCLVWVGGTKKIWDPSIDVGGVGVCILIPCISIH